MIKLLFICHGNICRSPMAEFVMKRLVEQAGLSEQFEIASAATSTEELGKPVYPMARQELAKHGIGCPGHQARQLTPDDYQRFDLIVGMDRDNIEQATRILQGDPDGKVRFLLPDREVADPWYTRDFRTAWLDINEGCQALLDNMQPND